MKKLISSFFLIIILFIITYFLFIFPFDIVNFWKAEKSFNGLFSLSSTLITFVLVRLYFSTKITFTPLRLFVCEGIGIGFISLNIICIISILDLLYPLHGDTKVNLFFVFLIILLAIGYVSTIFIKVKTITIQSNKIRNQKKIVFISDIHLGSNSINHFKKIIKKIIPLNPDMILIGGDLIDSSSFQIDQLSILNKINKPIYFVTGNHEYYLKNSNEIIDRLKEFNINLLDNKSSIIDDINIIGVSDNQSLKKQKDIFFSKKINNTYNLCLVHKPSLWQFIKEECDLTLSGHTHNGQILPFNFLVSLKFKEKFGLYKSNLSLLYVSSGSGTWGPKLRLGSFNEVISITLKP